MLKVMNVSVPRGARKTLQYYPDCCIEVHIGCGLENYGGSIEELISYFPRGRYGLFMALANDKCDFLPFNPTSDIVKGRFYLIALTNFVNG
jgi:hypothetical protein